MPGGQLFGGNFPGRKFPKHPQNTTFLKNEFDLEVTEISKKVPNISLTTKLLKNPTKATFIIAALKCSVKPLSKDVTAAFMLT